MNLQIKVWDGFRLIEPELFEMSTGRFYESWRDFEDGRIMNVQNILRPTGIPDKNGKQIYEADKLDNNEVVEFRDGCWFAGVTPLAFSASHREVVGNKYEIQ